MTKLILIAAQSLDGFITHHDKPGTEFCSPEDAAFFLAALKSFDSMVMGRKTYETLREQIACSKNMRYLRKICVRDPGLFADAHQTDLVEFTDAPPSDILQELHQRGRKRCALLGGGETNARFLEADLVDELWLTLEPLIFGSGTPLVSRPLEKCFALKEIDHLNADTLLLKYSRKASAD